MTRGYHFPQKQKFPTAILSWFRRKIWLVFLLLTFTLGLYWLLDRQTFNAYDGDLTVSCFHRSHARDYTHYAKNSILSLTKLDPTDLPADDDMSLVQRQLDESLPLVQIKKERLYWLTAKGTKRQSRLGLCSASCTDFYDNKQNIRAIMPLFWFGDSIPQYFLNFLYSIDGHPFVDVLVIAVDTYQNQCANIKLPESAMASSNVIFACASREAIMAEASRALCKDWRCSLRQQYLLYRMLYTRLLKTPYAWVELKPLLMHIVEPFASRCYSHWVIGDADTFHGSYSGFPLEILDNFDIVTIGNPQETLLYIHGQMTFIKRERKLTLLYKEMDEYRTFEQFSQRFAAIMFPQKNKEPTSSIAEGSFARAAFNNKEVSIISFYGMANILENQLYALVQYRERENVVLELDRTLLSNVSEYSSLPERNTVTLTDLVKISKPTPLVRGDNCTAFWWVHPHDKQCILPKKELDYPVIFRPSPSLCKKLKLSSPKEGESLFYADVKRLQGFDKFPGVSMPYFLHFRHLKKERFGVNFTSWPIKSGEKNRVYFFYNPDFTHVSSQYQDGSFYFSDNPLHELGKVFNVNSLKV